MPPLSSAGRRARYDAAIGRFADWLDRNQNPDGSFRGPEPSSIAYMSLPLYSHATGDWRQAENSWRILEERHLRDGELVQPDRLRGMLPYAAGWLVMGAALGENLRLCAALRRSLLSFQDPASGGFFGSAEGRSGRRGLIDFDSTTEACAGICDAGWEEAALACGAFLRRFLAAQPDPSRRLYLQWDSPAGLVRDFEAKAAAAHLLVYSGSGERLYRIGLLSRALALLYGLSGERAYLDLAEAEYAKAASQSPDIWRNTLAHKMGWAAWTLFGLTRKASYAEDACRMADHLVTLQQPDGAFHYPELWPGYDAVSIETKAGTAQFATWIAYARSVCG